MAYHQFGPPIAFNADLYPVGVVFAFEVNVKTENASYPVSARLWNVTDGEAVSGSTLSSASTTPVRLRSGSLSLANKTYRAEFGGDAAAVQRCYAADILAVVA